ncbi:hypothetical protein C8F04DRAFT_1124873 [Mycena alexandri]|uniref:Uncharacterized protein n=1 Tax=Mycena alexandri TaxID=1745969 RepID=A0AAD6SJK6_9AGAR|nr:hypothetical protein C8F04DRAFT_1124873 [Mycena alexandri]
MEKGKPQDGPTTAQWVSTWPCDAVDVHLRVPVLDSVRRRCMMKSRLIHFRHSSPHRYSPSNPIHSTPAIPTTRVSFCRLCPQWKSSHKSGARSRFWNPTYLPTWRNEYGESNFKSLTSPLVSIRILANFWHTAKRRGRDSSPVLHPVLTLIPFRPNPFAHCSHTLHRWRVLGSFVSGRWFPIYCQPRSIPPRSRSSFHAYNTCRADGDDRDLLLLELYGEFKHSSVRYAGSGFMKDLMGLCEGRS